MSVKASAACFCLVLALLTAAICPPAHAEYWDSTETSPVDCREDRPSCLVLQMVMMGSFADFDATDSLSVRVFSAALPRLNALASEDFEHFTEEFSVEADTLEQRYYIALGNCLWADILLAPQLEQPVATEARLVLKLFLDPNSEPNGREQMAIIRSSITDDAITTLAQSAALPVGFVEYLIYTEHWNELAK